MSPTGTRFFGTTVAGPSPAGTLTPVSQSNIQRTPSATPTSATTASTLNNNSVTGSQVPPPAIIRQPSGNTAAAVSGPNGPREPETSPITPRLESTAIPGATAEAYARQVNARKERLSAEMNPANIPERVKRRMEQLESMRAKVKAQMERLSTGTGESQKSILEDLRKEGFTVSLEKEDAAAAKELEMLKAGKYLDIFGDLYYTTLITPLEDSIGLSKAQSWNHLGLQSLNQFIINYNINTALGDDLERTLEIFLRVFGAADGAADGAATGTATMSGGASGETVNGPAGKLACTMDELRYLVPPLRHRMLTLRSQARLFTLNAGANSRALTPNAHHYLDVAERIGTFLASAVKKCGTAWNNMGAAKAAAAAPEPAPQSIISDDLMAKINEIHAYIKRVEAVGAEKKPTEPSPADLAREYLMQRFLDYQMLREDARSWLNKKLLKAAVQARFDALEERVAAVNPDAAARLEGIEGQINELLATTPSTAEFNAAIGEIHQNVVNATNYLDESIRGEIRNGVNVIIENVQGALDAHTQHAEELADDLKDIVREEGAATRAEIQVIQDQMTGLEEQRAANEERLRDLESERQALLQTIVEYLQRNQQLGEESERLRTELERTSEQLAQAAADNTALIAALNTAKQQYDQTIATIRQQIEALTAEKDNAERERNEAEGAASAKVAELEAQLATLRGQLAEQEVRYAVELERIADALPEDSQGDIVERIRTLREQLDGLRTQLDATQRDLTVANTRGADLAQQLGAAQTQNAELTAQIAELREQLVTVTATGEDAAGELAAAQVALTAKEGELADLRLQLAECNGTVAKLTAELATATAQGGQTAAALEAQLGEARVAQERVRSAMEAAGKEKATLQAEVARLQTEVDRLRTDNTTKQAKIAELETTLNAKTTELTTATSEIARLSALEGRADITPDSLADIQAAKAAAESAAAAAAAERDALMAQLAELGASREELAALREVKRTVDQLVDAFSRVSIKDTRSSDMMTLAKTLYGAYKSANLSRYISGGDYYNFMSADINTLKAQLYTIMFKLPFTTGTKGIVYPTILYDTPKRYFAYSTFENDQIMLFELLIALSNKRLITASNFDIIMTNMFFAVIRSTRYAAFFEATGKGETEAIKDTQKLLEERGIVGVDYSSGVRTPGDGRYLKYIKI